MRKIYAYTVYVGHLPVVKTNDYSYALEKKNWFLMKRPKAPVRIESIISNH
jgi:hypothetical protein